MSRTADDIIDQSEDRNQDDGCEYCGCALYPHEVTDEEIIDAIHKKEVLPKSMETDGKSFTMRYSVGATILWCTNSECKNYHTPIGGY